MNVFNCINYYIIALVYNIIADTARRAVALDKLNIGR